MNREDIPNRNRKVHQREQVDTGNPKNGPESEGVGVVPGFSEGNFCMPEKIFSLSSI
jgi:hypothetical protein